MIVKDTITGRITSPKNIGFLDRIFLLKATQGHWEVLDEILRFWSESEPERYESFIIEVDSKKGTRANKYASSKSRGVRSLVDVPEPVFKMLRVVYKPGELPMDKKFFEEMWRRYPMLRVAESL